MVSRCGPHIWARRQEAAYWNKDCEHSKSPEVRRRLPRPGEQMSAKQTLIYASGGGRKLCAAVHIGPCEARRLALPGEAVASFTGLKRRPPTSGCVAS